VADVGTTVAVVAIAVADADNLPSIKRKTGNGKIRSLFFCRNLCDITAGPRNFRCSAAPNGWDWQPMHTFDLRQMAGLTHHIV